MNYTDLIKEVASRSKNTERKLAQDDVKACIEILKEVVSEEMTKDDGRVVLRDFIIFEVKEQAGKTMPMYTGEKSKTPNQLVPKVKLSANMRNELRRPVK